MTDEPADQQRYSTLGSRRFDLRARGDFVHDPATQYVPAVLDFGDQPPPVEITEYVNDEPPRVQRLSELPPVAVEVVPTADTRGAAIPAQASTREAPLWDTRGAATGRPPPTDLTVANPPPVSTRRQRVPQPRRRSPRGKPIRRRGSRRTTAPSRAGPDDEPGESEPPHRRHLSLLHIRHGPRLPGARCRFSLFQRFRPLERPGKGGDAHAKRQHRQYPVRGPDRSARGAAGRRDLNPSDVRREYARANAELERVQAKFGVDLEREVGGAL